MKRKNKVQELDWFEAIQLLGAMNYASEEEEKAMSEEFEKFANTGIDWFHTNDIRKPVSTDTSDSGMGIGNFGRGEKE